MDERRMNEAEVKALEHRLCEYPVSSEWDLVSLAGQDIMQYRWSSHAKHGAELMGIRPEVMERAGLAIVGFVSDVVHHASEDYSPIYQDFDYDTDAEGNEQGNQILDVLRSTGALEKAGIVDNF